MTTPENDDFLEAFFDDAKESAPVVPDGLMARMIADAQAETDRRAQIAAASAPKSVWSQIMGAVGGWPALAGLSAATLTGVWIGLNPPAAVSDTMAQVLGQDGAVVSDYLFDPVTGFELAMLEG